MCLRLGGGADYRRHGGADGDDPGGQQDDDEDDDEDDDHDHHDQLHVFPPVGASHLLGRLLEVLSLGGERGGVNASEWRFRFVAPPPVRT